ncbi:MULTISPECIES: putative sporulation protein YtxC [Clostridia]|uniref:putative sporulation protein YtxC n=1 Tax=Clostridia TaxID=186801 RepID=UPI000EA1FBE9|nr:MULTISPECIES: putative sporulation protein YtxC [Clostridia]NBJ68974.1 putative sporulation protein YtxC [Roseburia sp. 1XD42-34]RKI79876.1 putative sporulation protein YtxC [Clostridium sp. 1xD42-85]
MIELFIESDKEVIRFCEKMRQHNKQINLYWKTHKDWGNHIQFDAHVPNQVLIPTIAKSLTNVFITHRLGKWITSVMEDFYFYTDIDEKEKIMELTNWVMTGKDNDSLFVRKNEDPQQILESLFIANIKDTPTIHYDSLVKFRLKVFHDYVVHYVGLAIDEYKREEEHQEFINMLRGYVLNRKSTVSNIYIIQGDTFSFFNQNGKALSHLELRMLMQKAPLYLVGLDENEFNLAPLIAMAPEHIYIYGDDPSEPKTLTVINVFQEKVTFEPLRQFPFSHYMQKEQH